MGQTFTRGQEGSPSVNWVAFLWQRAPEHTLSLSLGKSRGQSLLLMQGDAGSVPAAGKGLRVPPAVGGWTWPGAGGPAGTGGSHAGVPAPRLHPGCV